MNKVDRSITLKQLEQISSHVSFIGNIYVDKKTHTIKFQSSLPITYKYKDKTIKQVKNPTEDMYFNIVINTLNCPSGKGIIHDDDSDYKVGLLIDEEGKEIIFFDFDDAIISEDGQLMNLDRINYYAKCEWDRTEEDIIITVETEYGQQLVFPEDFQQ